MTWLGRHYSPEQVIEWVSRKEGSRAYYAAQFKHVFGTSLEQAWVAVGEGRARLPAAEPRGDSHVPGDAISGHHHPRARIGVARVLRSGREEDLRRIQLSGRRRRTSARSRPIPAGSRSWRTSRGRRIFTVTSLAWDPLRSRAVLHARQRRASRPGAARSGDQASAAPDEGRAHRRSRVQPGRSIALGHPSPQRHLHARADAAAVSRVEAGRHAGRMGPSCTISTFRPTDRGSSASFGEISGKQDVAHLRYRLADGPGRHAGRDVRLRHGGAERVHVHAETGARSTAARTSPACRTSSGTISRSKNVDAVTNAETGFFRPIPLADGGLDRVSLFGRRIRSHPYPAASARGRQRDHLSRRATGVGASDRQELDGRVAGGRAVRLDAEAEAAGIASQEVCERESFYPVFQGYKDTGAIGMRVQLLRSAAVQPRERRGVVLAGRRSPAVRARAPESRLRALRLARLRRAQCRGFLRSLRSDQDQPEGLSCSRSARSSR